MKTILLIFNLVGILAISGAMNACETLTTAYLYNNIATLARSEALNETKIKEILPSPEKGIQTQVLDCIFPEGTRNVAGLVAYPAIFLLSMNSLVLGISIRHEKKKKN